MYENHERTLRRIYWDQRKFYHVYFATATGKKILAKVNCYWHNLIYNFYTDEKIFTVQQLHD